jgi:hypothetical protein
MRVFVTLVRSLAIGYPGRYVTLKGESRATFVAGTGSVGRAGRLRGGEAAFAALAVAAQVFPRVDAAGVSVDPVELQCIAADGQHGRRLRRRRVHGQQLRGPGPGLAGLAIFLLTLFHAGGAGAGVAQPGETPGALVAVFPIDFEAFAFAEEHADLFRRDDGAGKRAVLLVVPGFLLLGGEADAFVAHISIVGQQSVTGGRGVQVYSHTVLQFYRFTVSLSKKTGWMDL